MNDRARPVRRYRVTASIGDPGRWVTQRWYPDARVWCDVGESLATEAEARARLQRILDNDLLAVHGGRFR